MACTFTTSGHSEESHASHGKVAASLKAMTSTLLPPLFFAVLLMFSLILLFFFFTEIAQC